MKAASQFLLLAFIFVSARAQTLPPELTFLAAKYDADVKTLDSERTTAAASLKAKYLADLSSAETAASSNGKVAEAAAIIKTRESLNAGQPEPASKTGMPPSLQKRHADYLAAIASLEHELAPKYSRASSDYLRGIATVEARLPSTSPVRAQIAEIKASLVNGSVQTRELLGTWQFVKSDWKGVRRFDADGTFADQNGKLKGKWTATASELRLEYGNGNVEKFQLPIKKKQMTGTSNEGGPLTATKQN